MSQGTNSNIAFTESEYERFYLRGNDNLTTRDIKQHLNRKGVVTAMGNGRGKARKGDIENLVFNHILREIPDRLFPIYRMMVEKLPFKEVANYVKLRRRCLFRSYYCNTVTGIILFNTVGKENDAKTIDEAGNVMSAISRGEVIVDGTRLNDESCTHYVSNSSVGTCRFCRKVALSFADDCIIKLGRDKFNQRFHILLPFLQSNILLKDIKVVIGIFYIFV